MESKRVPNPMLRWLHQVLLSLNVGFGLVFAFINFSNTRRATPHGSAHLLLIPGERLYLEWVVYLNQRLHSASLADTGRSTVGTVFIFLFGAVIFLSLCLISKTRLLRVVLDVLGGLSASALVPALWLYSMRANWPDWVDPDFSFWKSLPWLVFVVELPLVSAVCFLGRKWRRWVPITSFLLVLHCLLWLRIVAPYLYWMPIWTPRVLSIFFPASVFAWLLYVRELRRGTGTESIATADSRP